MFVCHTFFELILFLFLLFLGCIGNGLVKRMQTAAFLSRPSLQCHVGKPVATKLTELIL